jgi:hypothetical protein
LAEDGKQLLAMVEAFKLRTFTGTEVLEIADYLGAGVGATLAAAKRVEMARSRKTDADYDDPPMP